MERFIRDKYERLVWAPKDMGGRGGDQGPGVGRRDRSSPAARAGRGPAIPALGPRPSQGYYDDPAAPGALSGRGRRKTPRSPAHTTIAGINQVPNAGRGDALKTLVEMGT